MDMDDLDRRLRQIEADLAELKIDAAKNSVVNALTGGITSKDDLEKLRLGLLGKMGVVSKQFELAKSAVAGIQQQLRVNANQLKEFATAEILVRYAQLDEASLEAQLKSEAVDVTLPPVKPRLGAIHPVSQVMEELAAIFGEMGFSVEEGPDIETDFNNFTALNFPPNHPARDTQDTFFLNAKDEKGERKVLRTHTSPVQIRTMLKQKPPIRMICMGRTYRRDWDATHTPMFHQVEGLVIDETSTLADLKSVLTAFVKAYFEVDAVELRFRPHFFPFTEPSAEMDVQCDRRGDQCLIGQGKDWLELGGCGVVHPNVLRNCGIDPEKYQGYAWGFGIDRMAMLKYGMPDLRPFFDADTRWLKHYGFSPYLLRGLAQGVG